MLWLLTIPPFYLLLIFFIPAVFVPLIIVPKTRTHILSCYSFFSITCSLVFYKMVSTISLKNRILFLIYTLSFSILLIFSCIILEPKVERWQSKYISNYISYNNQSIIKCHKIISLPKKKSTKEKVLH